MIQSFQLYWKLYGGTKSLIKSAYLWSSIILSLVLVFSRCWLVAEAYSDNSNAWYQISLGVTPNLVGFSIGVYAMLMAMANTDFWKLMAERNLNNEEPTPYMVVNATFVHFVVVQIVTVLISLVFKYLTIYTMLSEFFGLSLFIYSLMTAIAAAFAILNVASWYAAFISSKSN